MPVRSSTKRSKLVALKKLNPRRILIRLREKERVLS